MTAKRTKQGPKVVSTSVTTSTGPAKGGGTVTRTHSTTVYAGGRRATYNSTVRTAPGRAPAKRKPVKTSRKRSAVGLLIHGDWVTGENDYAPTCVATAIANSLLAAKNVRVSSDDVLRLHAVADTMGGSIMAGLWAASLDGGLGGYQPLRFRQADRMEIGSLVGVGGVHAACWTEAGLISWGAPLDPDGPWRPDGEVWHVEWR